MESIKAILFIAVTAGLLFACTSKEEADNANTKSANIVDVTALDFKFEAPDEIRSGWNTFRFKNEGTQEHFLYLYRLPDNMTYKQFYEESLVPFGSVWGEYASGDIDRPEAEAKMGENSGLVLY